MSDPQPLQPPPTRGKSALIVIGHALLIGGALWIILAGWRRDFRVPLGFSIDSLLYLMQSKSTVDNGWWWFNPMLGAPFGLNQLAFPANSNVDQAIVWAISRFVRQPFLAVNLAWGLMVVLSGLSATWCLRKLGASTISAIVAGTLFAVSPFALYRNIAHFGMVIYLVPFVGTAALMLASGDITERWYRKGPFVWLLAGSAILSFNYVYYPFFGCFFLVVASIIGFLTHRRPQILAAGLTCVALIAACTVINLAPSLQSWRREGKPLILHTKVPAESEVYGLKVRQMVSPVFGHPFPPFRWWTEKESAAQFLLETENMTARLGLMGTLGFLGLLGLLLVPGAAAPLAKGRALASASQLTIVGVLFGTIGGFGSLFSLLVSSEIRAYSRIVAFILFFCLAALALGLDALVKTRARRIVAAIVILVIGLVDQGTAASSLNHEYKGITAELAPLRAFVQQLESRLPDRAMVFQLPLRTYLNDTGVARMEPYDHLKPYMVSRSLRWSYPALSNEQVRWQEAKSYLNPRRLTVDLAAEGFSAIVIDRYGYWDKGEAVIAGAALGLPPDKGLLASTDRYVALDIRSLAETGRMIKAPLRDESGFATRALVVCPGPVLTAIDQIGVIGAPRPDFHLSGRDDFKATGWAVDQVTGLPPRGVDIMIDQTVFPSLYGIDRADAADFFKRPAYVSTGFAAVIPMDGFSKGPHSLMLRVASSTRDCYYETGRTTMIVD